MNSTPDNPLPPATASAPVSPPVASSASLQALDETLRLIANAPVPEGLHERVHASIIEAAQQKASGARILAWPVSIDGSGFWAGNSWMRAAAAAAIVFVVAGGGWGVYQRAERPTAKVIGMPLAQPAAGGAFSSAGAIRTPQTVKGPMLAQPVATTAAKRRARKKTPPRSVPPGSGVPRSGVIAQPVSAVAGSK